QTVVAGEHYEAGGLHRLFLGSNYRDLWTAPVEVPVLDPDTFAGGLTVESEGGGLSTESLRLKGRNGREYTFRSVDKNVTPSMGRDLRGTLPHWVVQDLVSAKHPAAALVVPPLLEAVGVLHVVPRLYVMPEHRILGTEYRQFAGRLGQVEERPTNGDDDTPAFARAEDVEGSEDFREKIEEDAEERVDQAAFLTARLMDVLVGDWDRHWDQWRWARFDRGGLHWWRPIPRDRDNAFSNHGGLVPAAGRTVAPMLTNFGPEFSQRFGLIRHAAELDRLLLSGLDRADWDSVAQFIRTRVTDDVIDRAVRRLPPEYHSRSGEEMAAALRTRRDALPEFARWYYEQHAREVDIHSTDEAERAEVVRLADGGVEVIVRSPDDEGGQPYYRRRFAPEETREVRLFLHGGDDQSVVRGTSPESSILVRLIGGGGDDRYADESSAYGGRRTVFHDDRGDNQFQPGGEAKVDEREWELPARTVLIGNAPPPRDWGRSASLLAPWGSWQPNVGPVLGFGPTWTRYGFRRYPHARMISLRALWAPMEGGYGAEAMADFRHTNRPSRVALMARASNFEVVRFHGFGNDTPEDPDRDRFEVSQTQVRGQAQYWFTDTRRLGLYAGPVAKWTDPDVGDQAVPGLAEPVERGDESFAQYGAEAGARLNLRDSDVYPRRGAFFRATGAGYGSDVGTFGTLSGDAAGYLAFADSSGPVLALRAGGALGLGDFPFQEAPFIGGPGTVRGYPYQRFRGDAAVSGSAEARMRLARVNLLLVRPVVGVFALADAGRVYVDGESDGDWHTGFGGGLTFEALGRSATVSYARGERGIVYVTLGMPF
ncbi:MAG TPA: BamA/TamA family outer membrane protein, partial [Longimicrobium sp.]|nr:BamA/TamA family outer membrane protein [Longimicrobium sp.]